MNIGISSESRKSVSDALQQLLADEFLLYTKYRNYHWNIKAPNFSELHTFYEEHYDDMAGMIDDVAERIRTLGHISKGRVADFLELSQLEEQDYTTIAGEQLTNLIQDHEIIIRYLRNCVTEFDETHNDIGSSDFAAELMEKHEKMRWMLDSFIA
jgi:starvation-inducible DNA-binding protein